MIENFEDFILEFKQQINGISRNKIAILSKELNQARRERFLERRTVCEIVERGFTDDEFERFMSVVDSPIDKICFTFMAVLGLRVGELVALRGKDIQGDQLMIKSEKFCWNSIITIPQALFQLLPAAGPDEYVFDVHDFTLREHFKLYRARAGLDAIYMESAPRGVAGAPAKCRRLTLHSLRHYAIQRFY
ncbi:MAG: hypothetical protein WCT53_06350, partial [Candidatus Gracilibacteria bacterium]